MGNAPRPEERDGEYVSKRVLRAEAGALSLRVMASATPYGPAFVHKTCPLLRHADATGVVLLQLEAGSDCVIPVVAASRAEECPKGGLALNEEQRINVHVAEDQTCSFKVWDPPGETTRNGLFDIEIEVRLLRRAVTDVPGVETCSDDETETSSCDDDEPETDETVDTPFSQPAGDSSAIEIDGAWLTHKLTERLRNRWVCAGELLSVEVIEGVGGGGGGESSVVGSNPTGDAASKSTSKNTVRARVVSVNTADPKSADVLRPGYHCFRGVVTPETVVYCHAEGDECATSNTTVCGPLTVYNSTSRDDANARRENEKAETIAITTSDGEVFPVHAALLRPCLALTKFVRAALTGGARSSGKREAWELENLGLGGDDETTRGEINEKIEKTGNSYVKNTNANPLSIQIDLDCETLDRVLLWLECDFVGATTPEWDVRAAEGLIGASEKLGLVALADQCRSQVGAHENRIKTHSWESVKKHNASGGVRIVIDGMVLDVKRWLPEHPGGDRIIPGQSLGVDATRHFEVRAGAFPNPANCLPLLFECTTAVTFTSTGNNTYITSALFAHSIPVDSTLTLCFTHRKLYHASKEVRIARFPNPGTLFAPQH